MSDLVARLQSASPSRELDAEIALANGLVPDGMEYAGDGWWGGGGEQWHAPRYTESIDAALTLVPEGYAYQIIRYSTGACDIMITDGGDHSYFDKDAPSPALALLIAICKAKEGSKP